MNNLNVFRLMRSRSTRYYLTHPWEWFKDLKYCLRDAYQRITRGYADTDWFDMDSHLLELLPAMLKELAANSHSYPGHEPFDTPEKWSAWLNEMADTLIGCREEEIEKTNEYYEDYMDLIRAPQSSELLTWNRPPDQNKIVKLYLAREHELEKAADQRLCDVFLSLGQNLRALWD